MPDTAHPQPRPAAPPADLYALLETVPERYVCEIIASRLSVQPRPAPRHALAHTRLASLIDTRFGIGLGGPGGWRILIEPELHLGEHVLVPGIAGWRTQTLPDLPETAWFETPPDWVCEVLSPSTRSLDLHDKPPVYAAHGTGHRWTVDPATRTLDAFALDAGDWRYLARFEDGATVRAAPFDTAPFDLSLLWATRT